MQGRVDLLIAEMCAARAEVAVLKAVKKSSAEQALSHEAQVTASHCKPAPQSLPFCAMLAILRSYSLPPPSELHRSHPTLQPSRSASHQVSFT